MHTLTRMATLPQLRGIASKLWSGSGRQYFRSRDYLGYWELSGHQTTNSILLIQAVPSLQWPNSRAGLLTKWLGASHLDQLWLMVTWAANMGQKLSYDMQQPYKLDRFQRYEFNLAELQILECHFSGFSIWTIFKCLPVQYSPFKRHIACLLGKHHMMYGGVECVY